jgi:glycosyltransferase involved in cell wall biosynthesis
LHTTYYDNVNFTNKPIVITVYDLIHEIFSKEFNFNLLPKKDIFKRADHFICISKNTQKDLIKYYGIEEKKTSVVYLSSFNKPNFSTEKFLNNKPYFLYVGSRKRYKNFTLLIKAFCGIKSIYQNFDIICFGGGKFIKEEYELFNKLGVSLNSIIQLDGNDEFLLKLYKGAATYICTSKYEGFGLPILEAMSCGCPVISSNASSLPEVYGDAALSFSSNSLEDLMECLKKITMNNSFKNELINKGFQQSNQFSWKKCAKETSLIYEKLNNREI